MHSIKRNRAKQAFRHFSFSSSFSYAFSPCCRGINHFAASKQILTHNSVLQQPKTIHNRRASIIQRSSFWLIPKWDHTAHFILFTHFFESVSGAHLSSIPIINCQFFRNSSLPLFFGLFLACSGKLIHENMLRNNLYFFKHNKHPLIPSYLN